MALNATMFRFNINLSDLQRSVYQDFSVSVALHPSETLERMAIRLLAYCLHYDSALEFTKGLSEDTEPDIWKKNYSGDIETWIELGLPDGKRMKKASTLADEVIVYAYGGQAIETWWQQTRKDRARLSNIRVRSIAPEGVSALAEAFTRGMSLSCVIDDNTINVSWDDQMLEIEHADYSAEGV